MRDDEKTNEVAMKVCDGQSETMNQIPKLHMHPTVDGGNPAPLDMVVHPIIYEVLYIPGSFLAGFLNHQQYVTPKGNIPTIHFQGIC